MINEQLEQERIYKIYNMMCFSKYNVKWDNIDIKIEKYKTNYIDMLIKFKKYIKTYTLWKQIFTKF